MALHGFVGLLKSTLSRWRRHKAPRLGAALAYYTLFSLAPVMLIALAIASLFYEKHTARAAMLANLKQTVGSRVANAVGSMVENTHGVGTSTLATIVGLVVLVFAATSMFNQLQDALNTVWGVRPRASSGWRDAIKARLWSFSVVLGIGVLLLASLTLSEVLAFMAHNLPPADIPGGLYIWKGLNWFVSPVLVTLLFAIIYKLLPDAKICWGDVWIGAAVTALLFVLGNELIGFHLGHSSLVSTYGAAGSLVVVLLWVYYSAQIFLFGAEFTYVYASRTGKPIVPKENAEPLTADTRAQEGVVRQSLHEPNKPGTEQGDVSLLERWRFILKRLRARWESLQVSFWFIPAVMTAIAGILAQVGVRIDESMQNDWIGKLAWVYTRGPDGARSVLSTVAESMITVAGVVFSVTIVALSLASNQFGPRLLRNFMRDRGNQIVLGTFVSTYVYCLLVLRTVSGVTENEFVPHFSVTLGIGLALVSLGVLIYFIHHVAISIQAPEIVANVANDLHEAIDRLFPDDIGQGSAEDRGLSEAKALPAGFDSEAAAVASPANGYVQVVDGDQLLALASQYGLVIRICRRPGNFVVKGSVLAQVWPGDRLDDVRAEQVRDTFLFGTVQTPIQDVEFVVNQLVEVAVRALSPGINDPFTAMTCLDRLGEGLCHLAGRKVPSPFRHDEQGQLRVVAHPFTFAELANTAFRQIRHYGRSSAAVLTRQLDVITEVLEHARREEDRQALRQHAVFTRNAGTALPEEEDRLAFRIESEKALAAPQHGASPPGASADRAGADSGPTVGSQ
jgi:YihY family inner membrane protein